MGNAQSGRHQHYGTQQPQTMAGHNEYKDYRYAQQSQPQPQMQMQTQQQPGYNLEPPVAQQYQHSSYYRSKGERRADKAERRVDKALYKAERRVERAEYKAGRRIDRAEHRAERRAAKCCGGHSRRCHHDAQFVVSSDPPAVAMGPPPAVAMGPPPAVAMGPPPARSPVYSQQQNSFPREPPSAAEAQTSGAMPPAYEEVAREEKSRGAFSH